MNDAFEYEAPRVYTLGTVEELTQVAKPDKCGGSGDTMTPQVQLDPRYGTPHC